MPRADLDLHFAKIDALIAEINGFVPSTDYRAVQFRSELAGLLVVAMAATYETCVKDILYEYANRHHVAFGKFALRNYEKLNSRVQINDLRKYCELFDPAIKLRFRDNLSTRKKSLLDRTGKNIETSYEQILSWRHDFAHARIRNTTIEEAGATHRLGKRVLYVFDEAFSR
jgi:RiboL-PSP-HEPN